MTGPHQNSQPSETPPQFPVDFDRVAEIACKRLRLNNRVRRNLPGGGRLRFDRQLPFLCVYRSPPDRDEGTRDLVTTEAAYLFASGAEEHYAGICGLCQQIAAAMQEHFGTFLLIEIWAEQLESNDVHLAGPAFEIVALDPESMPRTMQAFQGALEKISILGQAAKVDVRKAAAIAPPVLSPLEYACPERGSAGCCMLGLAVKPIFRDPQTGVLYPILLETLRWQLGAAIRKAVASFTGDEAGKPQTEFQTLGPTSLVKAARLIDQQLCEVAESFDFLMQATPVNSEAAWREFVDGRCERPPTFHYRPLPYHPQLLKRRLFDVEIERIEDPTLAHLFWEKQTEMDRQLTALNDLDTPKFLFSSQQLYGAPDAELISLAREILVGRGAVGGSSADDECSTNQCVPVLEVVERAREEIDYYHQRLPAFNASVEISNRIASGIMVSRGRLLISETLRLRRERIEPLLHHEIGTHLLTYYNGRCQPFRQLYTGLAGYEELQEGLAVLAEYLCGGLSPSRLANLAGRVLAVAAMAAGKPFLDAFRMLHRDFGFTARQSFVTTMRAYRGGGLTKDLIYLRGLRDLLRYLAGGHELEPLYVGKIGLPHLPYVQELRRRGIIQPPSLLPRFWDDVQHRERLEACRGKTVLQLLEHVS